MAHRDGLILGRGRWGYDLRVIRETGNARRADEARNICNARLESQEPLFAPYPTGTKKPEPDASWISG